MAEERIDSLSIEIETSAERAVKGLDDLTKSTSNVGKALKNVKTSGLDKVSKDAVDSAKSVQNLNSKMESLFAKGEAAGKKFFSVDNMGLKEAEKKLEVLKNSYNKAMDTINTKMASGIFGGTTFENQVIQAGKLATRIDMVKERIEALKSAQDSMKPVDFFDRPDYVPSMDNNMGQIFVDMSESAEEYQARVNNVFAELRAQMAETSTETTQVGQALKEAIEVPTENTISEELTEVSVGAENATSAIQRFKEWVNSSREEASTMGEAFENLGKATFSSIFNLPKNLKELFQSLNDTLDETKGKLKDIDNKGDGVSVKDKTSGLKGSFGNLFSGTGKSSATAGKGLKNVLGLMKKLVPSAKSLKRALGGLNLTNNGLAKSLLRTGKMLKLMVVRMALRGVITGAKEGFQNLIQYSDSTKASMQQLVSSLDYLKNSFAAAFAPIINTVAPIISTFIDYLVSAVNAINQLVSSLLGFSTWTKATKLVSNYGNAVGGASKAAKDLNKQLQGFDELNNLTTNQGGGSGGGSGAGTNYADMFTTEEVDGYWKSIADRIKDTWNFDDADFTWLGASLGEKISEQLDGLIEKHPKIKDNARKIGKALGTTITGFVETPNLGYKVGTVIGNAIDTAVTGLDGFVTGVHWDSVGTFIGQGINGIANTELIHDVFTLLKDTINGGIDFLWSSGDTIDFKGIGGKIGEELSNAIGGLEAKKAGEALSKWIRGGLQAITEFLYKTDFEQVGQKLADFLNGLDWTGILWDLANLAGAIIGALFDALKGLWSDSSTKTKIGLAIGGLLGVASITGFGGLTSSIASVFGGMFSATGKIAAVVAAGIAGWEIGQWIYDKWGDKIDKGVEKIFGEISITSEAEDKAKKDDAGISQYAKDVSRSYAISGRVYKESVENGSSWAEALMGANAYGEQFAQHFQDGLNVGMSDVDANTYAQEKMAGMYEGLTGNASKANRKLGLENTKIVSGIKQTSSKLATPFKTIGNNFTNLLKTASTSYSGISKSASDTSTSLGKSTDSMIKKNNDFASNSATTSSKTKSSFNEMYSAINTGAGYTGDYVSDRFNYMRLMSTAQTEEQRKEIKLKYEQMLNTTKTNTGSMSSDVLSKFTSMNTDTTSKSQSMVATLKTNLGLMKSNTNTETSSMASTVLSKFTAMNSDTSTKSTGMLNALKNNLASMKSSTNSETSSMQTTISNWSTKVKNLVTNTKGTAKFDVETPTQSTVSQKLEALKKVWAKGGKADFSLNFGASSSSISEMANKAIEKVKQAFNNSGVTVLKNAVSKLKFFAKGGVVDKATLGIFGEAGTEAIMPLERNTEWIGKLSTMIVTEMPSLPSYQSSSNESAILEQNRLLAEQNALLRQIANKDVSISSRDVFNAVRNENNDYVNRTGASPFFV